MGVALVVPRNVTGMDIDQDLQKKLIDQGCERQ